MNFNADVEYRTTQQPLKIANNKQTHKYYKQTMKWSSAVQRGHIGKHYALPRKHTAQGRAPQRSFSLSGKKPGDILHKDDTPQDTLSERHRLKIMVRSVGNLKCHKKVLGNFINDTGTPVVIIT